MSATSPTASSHSKDADASATTTASSSPLLIAPAHAVALTAGFALVAGWADVVCFKAFGSFAALMTGNTVKMGLAVFDGSSSRSNSSNTTAGQAGSGGSGGSGGNGGSGGSDTAYYGSILCSYIFGVWLFNLIKHLCPARPGLAASPVCVSLFLIADLLHAATSDSKWRVCLLAPCFGAQNSLTFGGPLSVNTTIITGNMAKIGNALWKAGTWTTCQSIHCTVVCTNVTL